MIMVLAPHKKKADAMAEARRSARRAPVARPAAGAGPGPGARLEQEQRDEA